MKQAANHLITLSSDIVQAMAELKEKGVEVNSVMIREKGISFSLNSGIEKAAGVMGAELYKSPRGFHLCFELGTTGSVHFGQRIKGSYEDLY